jgi:hypothetical protein
MESAVIKEKETKSPSETKQLSEPGEDSLKYIFRANKAAGGGEWDT